MGQELPVSFGCAVAAIDVGGFRVTQACYAAGKKVPKHEHEFASWTVVTAGEFEEQFDEAGYACRPGDVLAKPATAAHGNTYGASGAQVLIVEIGEAAIDEHAELRAMTQAAVRLIPASAVGSRVRRLRLEMTDPQTHLLGAHAAILDLGLLLLRTQPRRPRDRSSWLKRATDQLSAEFRHPPSLSVLAATCGVHPVHLCAAFRSAHGCSPGEFVRRQRIEQARRLLAMTGETIATVALTSGFSDQSHLTRQFRRATGMTPAAYRRSASRAS